MQRRHDAPYGLLLVRERARHDVHLFLLQIIHVSEILSQLVVLETCTISGLFLLIFCFFKQHNPTK